MSMHNHWRTVEEWRRLNVPLSTPSDTAAKMYDATISQLMAMNEDSSVGGVEGSLKEMMQADPNFVVGQAIQVGLQAAGLGTPALDPTIDPMVQRLVKTADSQPHLAPAERKHVTAAQLLADGKWHEASLIWEDILADHPHDFFALKMVTENGIYSGNSTQLRDVPARVLYRLDPNIPLYSYVVGYHAFGLEETNMYHEAEKQAMKSLDLNRENAWATHALTHVYEMTGQADKGVNLMTSTVKDWLKRPHLACHNYWHLALHYNEKGEFKKALEIFDDQILPRLVDSRSMFCVSDAVCLLYRLEFEGVDVSSRWRDMGEIAAENLANHNFAFFDVNMLMALLGNGDSTATQKFTQSLEDFVRDGRGTCRDTHKDIGLDLCSATVAYKEGRFADVVDTMYPLRSQLYRLGGSHAQRDVFNLLLIASALKSSQPEHHRKARALIAERQGRKENSPLNDRLLAKALALS